MEPQNQRLARTNYVVRAAAFVYCFVALGLHFWELGAAPAAWALLVVQFVLYPHIAFLRARGLSERSVVYRHALRGAALPVVTVAGIQFGVLLGGAIVIETLFGLPGVGRLVVTAINQRNYTVVQGCVLVIAALFIVVNLITDLLYGWLDPRTEGPQ